MSETKSIVHLRFYHTSGSLSTVAMVMSISAVMGVGMLIIGFNAIISPTSSRFLVETILCYGGVGLGFIAMGVFGMRKLLSGRELLELVSTHLLKLNAEQATVEPHS